MTGTNLRVSIVADVLGIAILTAIIVMFAFQLHGRTSGQRSQAAPTEVSLRDAATDGAADAPLGFMVLCDFRSDRCAAFVRDALPKLKAEFVTPGKVRLAFRYRSSNATVEPRDSRLAVCLGQQGSFWSFYESVLSQTQPIRADVQAALAGTDYDVPAVRACAASQEVLESENAEDLADATLSAEVPAFLMGPLHGDRLQVRATYVGPVPFTQLRRSLKRIEDSAGPSDQSVTRGG
jgi:hypothetical protein